ncbi:MAG TPA: polysaccharide ABC transporter ATP-binding protein [Gemmatimonadales bacterium]|nr:polysaccharide ABC transporter ATP-binding protein [Gemmatimonadales bacterium]
MSADLVLQVEGLGKQYRIGQARGSRTLREAVAETFGGLTRRVAGGRGTAQVAPPQDDHSIWALRDVSFEVHAGEVVGIVGGNGAGKSTLLRILSRITEPTEGRADVTGRVGALLEVGSGFHPELTGRENIYLNGSILGMRKAEIARKFDEIVEFAEIGQFLDTPVKRYSSGMYVRLAFAVAAHLDPDILIVDEVLAVGDVRFQRKCLNKMQDVSRGEGRTVLFVSHNMNAIQRLCTRCLLFEHGRLVTAGDPVPIVSEYLAASSPTTAREWIDVSEVRRAGTGEARVTAARYSSLSDAAAYQPYPDGPFQMQLVIDSDAARTVSSVAVTFFDPSGTKLVNADTLAIGRDITLQQGRNLVTLRIPALHLNPGVYLVGLWLANPGSRVVFDHVEAAFQVEVITLQGQALGVLPDAHGAVTCDLAVLDVSALAPESAHAGFLTD